MSNSALDKLAYAACKYYMYNNLTVPKIKDRLDSCNIKILNLDDYPEWILNIKYDLGIIIEYTGKNKFYVMLDPVSEGYSNKRIYSIKTAFKKNTNVDKFYIIRYGPTVKAKHIIGCLIRILKDHFFKQNHTKRTYIVI